MTVGRYALDGPADQAEVHLQLDVSDEWCGDGRYIVGLEQDGVGYFAVTEALLTQDDMCVSQWSGDTRSRRTFAPPVLVPLEVGPPVSSTGLSHPAACRNRQTAWPATWTSRMVTPATRLRCLATGPSSTG